jgi:hypothetical protein
MLTHGFLRQVAEDSEGQRTLQESITATTERSRRSSFCCASVVSPEFLVNKSGGPVSFVHFLRKSSDRQSAACAI